MTVDEIYAYSQEVTVDIAKYRKQAQELLDNDETLHGLVGAVAAAYDACRGVNAATMLQKGMSPQHLQDGYYAIAIIVDRLRREL